MSMKTDEILAKYGAKRSGETSSVKNSSNTTTKTATKTSEADKILSKYGAKRSDDKADVSGEAWTRATPSQTVITNKPTSTPTVTNESARNPVTSSKNGRSSGGFSGKSSVEDGSPVYNRRTAERMAETFTNAENALTQKRDSGIDIATEVEQRSKDIENQVNNLKALEDMFNKDKSEANAQKYNSAYEKYAKDVEDYNNLYNEYKALYDAYSAAYDNYTNYMDTAKSDATWFENANDAFWTGIAGIDKAFTSTLAFPERALQPIIQTIMPGVSTPLSDLADYYSDIYEDVANRRADNLYGKGKIAELASDAGTATIQALPNAILALMSSGTSIAGQGAAALGTATNTGLASTISNSLQTMAKNPMYWSSFIQTVGNDYDENIENGASNLEAVASALISSALNAGVEIGGGIETLPDAVKNGGNSAVKEWVKSMLDEGKEEVIQDIISGITQKAVYDQDKTWFSTTDEDAVVNPGVLAKDFGMGAAVGGILGGGQAAAINVLNRMNDRRLGKIGFDYSEVAQELIDEGLTFDKNTEAYQTAEELKARLDAGETISNSDLGRAVIANQRAIELEQANNPDMESNNARNTSYIGVQAAYEAGKAELPRERANLETDAQVTAYEQGRRDAILTSHKDVENTAATAYTDVINTKEAVNNGEQGVHLREGSQRADGTNPVGQVRQLEEGTGRDQSWNTQRRPRDGEAAQISYGRKVSTADLGIKGGSKNDGVFLIKSGTTKSMQRAQQIAQQNGKELILFGGHDLHTDKAPDGARGYTDGKRIFARVDDPDFTVDQIVRHETGHNLIAEGKVDMDEVRKRVASAVGEDKVDTAASLYAAAYSGTDMTSDDIWEEIVCDSLGDMNIFEGIDTVETFMSDFLGVTKQETETSQSTTRGPPVTTDKNSARIGGNKNDRRRTEETRGVSYQGDRVLHWTETTEGRREAPEHESRFLRRMGQSGATLRRVGTEAVFGYTTVPYNRASSYAKQAAQELRKLGTNNFFIFDGELQWNDGRTTYGSRNYAATLSDGSIGINNSTELTDDVAPPAELAAHETIHMKFNSGVQAAVEFRKAVVANAKVNSRLFRRYFDLINYGYHNGVLNFDNVNDRAEFFREFIAYVGGFIYAGNVDVSSMFEDYGAVCSALEKALGVKIKESGRVKQTSPDVSTNASNNVDVDVDVDTESVNPGKFSMRTWNASEYVQNRDEAAKEIAQAIGVSEKKAKQYIDDVNSIAYMIANEKGRLDYNETGLSPFVSNAEYGGSFDFTTLCKKRRLLTGTFSEIQKALKNTALTAQEILDIRKMMDDAGLEVSCGKCYVEGSRANMGQFTKQFIELYKKYNPGKWYPNMAEMNTPDGIEWVRITHPEVYEQYEYFWNHYGKLKDGDPNLFASQQKPKLYQMRSAYNGEILQNFKSDGKIEEKNRNGGIRMQSFSDFEIVHLIDAMQTIMDMSRVGLNGQAYTKVADFAWALGDTGLKINLSIDAWAVDENGKLIFNNKEGMPFETAMELRNAYSKNVGTICCVYDDAQLLAALADDRIDYIIPFHRSQWKKAQYKAMGLPATTKDYTYQQNEKWLDPSKHTHEYQGKQVKTKCKNYMPNEYWDFTKSGKENAEEYLRMCARDGKRPKFYKFLDRNADGSFSLKKDGSTDGYWKLMIDFKMYDNDGNGSPQMPVRPDFNMEQCYRMLNEYEGGHQNFPVAQGIVDEFVAKYKESHKDVSNFSRRINRYEALQQENELLRERLAELKGVQRQLDAKTKQAEYWKGQTKRTNHDTLRQADVDKLTKRIVSEFESTVDAKEISGAVKDLGEFILRGGEGKDELTWAGVKERAVAIARDIVESAVTLVNGDEVSTYKDIKKLLRRKMSISAQDARDIADFSSWKKEHSRKINIGIDNGGIAVDVAYQELSEGYPWAFPEDVTAPSDQLLQMADVLYSMQPIYENPYSANMLEAVEYCANSIIDGLMDEDVRQTPLTFADKQAAKLSDEKTMSRAQAADAKVAKKQAISDATLAGQMAQGRADAKLIREAETMLERAKSDARAQAADAKAAQKQAAADAQLAGQMAQGRADAKRLRASEQRYEQRLAAARQAIEDERVKRDERVQRLKDHYAQVRANQQAKRADSKARTRLLNIARRLKNKKLPAVNRALLNQYIGELDTVSKSMTGRTLEKLTDLQAWYNDRKANDPDFIADPVIERKLERLAKRQISSMTSEEVADLTDTLLNIEHELQTERKLIDSEDRRDVYHMGEETIENISNTRGSNGNAVDKFIVTETLSPVREMRRMTGYVDSDPLLKATNSLADGQRNMLDYQMKAERPFERFANDKVFSRMFSGKQADAIQVTGETKDGQKTVTITPAMRTALYLHSLNDQNLRHIKEGGITVPDEKLYRAGKLSEAYARGTTIKLTPSQVRSITAHMTDKERSFALAAQKYFNDVSKKSINETSEKLKGYSLADVENYFPINTDTSFTRSDFESLKFDGTIEGMGFLKERVNAANPILLRDANAVLEQAIQMHSKYVGLAIPVRNFNKIWSVTTGSFNEDGSRNNFEGSVQNAIKGKWGEAGYSYVEKMMGDLQGGQKQKNVWASAMNKLRSNYAGAVLTLNLSVAMKQAASYPTAASVLGWTPLVKAMGNFGKVDLSLIEKYTPLQWYRSKGFSTKELGDLKSSDRALPAILNWVQGVDLATTRKLWKASEYYVQMHNKALERGSDAYYRAVADIYNRVIEETQPNYTTMQRPQLLRSDDTLMGNLAMFKTQPFQNFNILYDAAENLLAKKERAKSGEAQAVMEFKTARTDFGHAVTSQLAQLAVFAGMTAAWAMMRGKPDKYEDEEKDEITMKSFLAAYAKDMVGGAMSSVPFGSDAWELISSKVFGDKYYGMDVVTVSAITDTVKSVSSFAEMVSRIGNSAIKGDEIDWNKERLNLDSILDDVSKAAGVPYENVANMVNMIARNAAIAGLGKYQGEYAYLKLTSDPEKYSGDYYDLMFRALKNGAIEDYQSIMEDFVPIIGKTGEDAASAMRSRYKNALKKDVNFTLSDNAKALIGWIDKYDEPEKAESFGPDDLDAGVYQVYSNQRANIYQSIVSDLENNKEFNRLGGEYKNKALAAADALSSDISLRDNTGEEFTDASLNQWERWATGGDKYGVDETEAILFKLAYEMAESEKDKDGKTISGSKKENTLEIVDELIPGLSNRELEYLMSMYWTPEDKNLKKLHENKFMP